MKQQGCCCGEECGKGCEEHRIQVGNASGAKEAAQPSKSEHLAQTKLRYTNSLDSAAAWRRNLRRRPLGRHLLSAMTMVSFSMAVIVLGSMLWFRRLSWDSISTDLLETSEAGQRNSVEQVSKAVLQYFQLGSKTARVTMQLYSSAFAKAADDAHAQYWSHFAKVQWSSLVTSEWVNDVLVTQARHPDLVNPAYPQCDMDSVLIGDGYSMVVNPNTSGVPPDRQRLPGACEGACLHLIKGGDDLTDPLGFRPGGMNVFHTPCNISVVASGAFMWQFYALPGTWEEGGDKQTGLFAPQWQTSNIVDYEQGLVRKAVLFRLPGAPWAPDSAFGRVTIRVADYFGNFGGVNLQTVLQGLPKEKNDEDEVIFLMTPQGELLASSVKDQRIVNEDIRENQQVRGLLQADDDRVSRPIRSVARHLIAKHCVPSDSGDLYCNWPNKTDFSYVGDFGFAAKKIDDDLAAGLGMLLVDAVKRTSVTLPVDEINDWISIITIVVGFIALILFMMLSRQVTVPLRKARDNMFLLSDMQIDDAIAEYSETSSCNRMLFTEASDLRFSFLHAASALRSWRMKEIERRTLLEEERAHGIQHAVRRAVQGAGKLMHPMVLISAEAFQQMQRLTSYEELRNTGKLQFLDTEDDLAKFKLNHSIIFLSHQWLGWGYPDDQQGTQLKAMKSAVRTAANQMRSSGPRGAWRNLYVWVDYCSIAQEHRGMQTLAVSSLPVYASSADAFIIVAPPAKHVQSNDYANLDTYNSRGWCRAEMLSKICSSGLENFFVLSTEGGDLQRVTEEWLPMMSMYVFEGQFSCCQQGHKDGSCDKEALVEPVLGLYSLVLQQIGSDGDSSRRMEQVNRHIRQSKERFFPKRYAYKVDIGDAQTFEERELFGALVEELETYMDRERNARRLESSDGFPVEGSRSKVFWIF